MSHVAMLYNQERIMDFLSAYFQESYAGIATKGLPPVTVQNASATCVQSASKGYV